MIFDLFRILRKTKNKSHGVGRKNLEKSDKALQKMDTDKFLANTSKLFEALHVFEFSSGLKPQKDHTASHIELIDFKFNNSHFIKKLRGSIVDWVFSKQAAKEIFDREYGADQDLSSASATLYNSARETMRLAQPQGQFGELLLSAFIQHLFKAAPLLRKQTVRTSDKHERFGADALHFKGTSGNDIYLGESKCYKSSYQFPKAFSESLQSMETTLNGFTDEIRKFIVGGFIDPELRPVAEKILSNKLENPRIHPVSIIIYNETKKFDPSGPGIKIQIKDSILQQCKKIDESFYEDMDQMALSRFTYIVVPVWNLDSFLDEFVSAL